MRCTGEGRVVIVIIGIKDTDKDRVKSELSRVRTIRGIRYQFIEDCEGLSDVNIYQVSHCVYVRVRTVHTKVYVVTVDE